MVGSNSRLDELQAAILRVKLKHLDRWNDRRRAIAARYIEKLSGTGIGLPAITPGAFHVWHQFVVRHPYRDSLRGALTTTGIETLIHYENPPHRQAAYADLGLGPGSLPVTERLAREILSLPVDPCMSAVAQDAVITALSDWLRSGAGEP
jgi:dTDP-4-amino-4,6-dideoxygalactose transaminase